MSNVMEEKQNSTGLLHLAVMEANLEVAYFLLKHGICPNERATVKQLRLDVPTDAEYRRFLCSRLGVGAEVAVAEALNGKSCTALHVAARCPKPEAAELLLRHDADVNAEMEGGETPLLIAVLSGSLVVVELLLSCGADVNARTAWDKSILHYAARAGQREVVELLLARGGHVNAADPEGLTALHIAAEAGDKEMVDLLLEYAADVGLKDKSGATPLHHAAVKGHIDVVETMLSHGADINLILRHGGFDLTPFKKITAAQERRTMEIVSKFNTKAKPVSWYNSVMAKFRSSAKDKMRLFYAESE